MEIHEISREIILDMGMFDEYAEGHLSGLGTTEIHSCPELMELVQRVGFLPLLDSGVRGYSAEALMAEECRYTVFDDGSWEWPLWQWKGPVVTESPWVYGRFFAGKAGFISMEWWPDFCNWRRSSHPRPEDGSIEAAILDTLMERGSMINRELRAVCGFTGSKMRSRFDGYVNRLQMACLVVTENFVYPRDKHGHEYGFGWSLLTTPERLLGHEACHIDRDPQESYRRMSDHLSKLLPQATERQIAALLR